MTLNKIKQQSKALSKLRAILWVFYKKILNPIPAGGDPPWRFLEITRKVLVSTGYSNFLNFLTNTLGSKWGFYTYCQSPQAYCLNALFYSFFQLNLYLDLFLVIEFWLFIALRKASNKKKQIAQFLRRNFT